MQVRDRRREQVQIARHEHVARWAGVPLGVAGAALTIAALGFCWDVAWHIDLGRDKSLFTPAHVLIVVGLLGVFASGLLATALYPQRPSQRAIHLAGRWVPGRRTAAARVRRRRARRRCDRRRLGLPVPENRSHTDDRGRRSLADVRRSHRDGDAHIAQRGGRYRLVRGTRLAGRRTPDRADGEAAGRHVPQPTTVPVGGDWKTSLRLARGADVKALALSFPYEPESGKAGIPAVRAQRTQFGSDSALLLRESKGGTASLMTLGYAAVGAVVIGWIIAACVALSRLSRCD
jgi:hypothetical protein